MKTTQRLAIIGAGPKAMAIAAKSAVLAELGFTVPEIHIIEKRGVGANWTGDSGYTNGRLALGTSPEKDVGFPYRSAGWGASIDESVNRRMKEFSWQSHLIEIGSFSDWVDQGRPAPQHREWAAYLQWVWTRVRDRTACHRGEVVQLAVAGEQWQVTYATDAGERQILPCDGLVVTGPGRIGLSAELPVHDRVLTVESFWKRYRRFSESGPARIALVGTGENAAAIAIALVESGNEGLQIDVLSPLGMTFSRGESFRENRVYSDERRGNWDSLTLADRRAFIRRTDRGVFSLYAQRILDPARNLDVVPGRLVQVTAEAGDGLVLTREYDGKTSQASYDYVVLATGSDQLAFLRGVMDPRTQAEVTRRAGLEALCVTAVEPRIDRSLALSGLSPRLHLPMLSGVAQGPGFSNLSCLGRLSDRILENYLRSEK